MRKRGLLMRKRDLFTLQKRPINAHKRPSNRLAHLRRIACSRRSALDRLSTGAADLVVGTHALLSAEVQFRKLGLVVVDEQHRFGVAQRLRLTRSRGEARPHLLVMTATPIPRSLALVVYAGLQLTTIDEKPPGRQPPLTRKLLLTRRLPN